MAEALWLWESAFILKNAKFDKNASIWNINQVLNRSWDKEIAKGKIEYHLVLLHFWFCYVKWQRPWLDIFKIWKMKSEPFPRNSVVLDLVTPEKTFFMIVTSDMEKNLVYANFRFLGRTWLPDKTHYHFKNPLFISVIFQIHT